MRALDIGACDGFFSFELERRGAEVVALDYRSPDRTGFAVAKELLGSAVEYVHGNVHDLEPETFGTFDLILFLGLLYHLRDPLHALDRIWDVCRDTLIIETRVLDGAVLFEGRWAQLDEAAPGLSGANLAQFYPDDGLGGDPTNWWVPSSSCLASLAHAAGFDVQYQATIPGSRGVLRAVRAESLDRLYWRRIAWGLLAAAPPTPVGESDPPASADDGATAAGAAPPAAAREHAVVPADRALELPLPPLEMRKLVGETKPAFFDNPTGSLVLPKVPEGAYASVLDFGCGCGRIARQLIQQRPQPGRYVGTDLHLGMVRWCERNLHPHAPTFEFNHHDVGNRSFNPGEGKPHMLPLPGEDDSFTLVIAHSVFTHLDEAQALHYLQECSRVLCPGGLLYSTWFLFEKELFPMLQEETNALYVSYEDPSAAVLLARWWVQRIAASSGLTICDVAPPLLRGYQWTLLMSPSGPGVEAATLPPDGAPTGVCRAPGMPADASRIGLG